MGLVRPLQTTAGSRRRGIDAILAGLVGVAAPLLHMPLRNTERSCLMPQILD